MNENINENNIESKRKKLNSTFSLITFFKVSKLAPARAGIDKKNDIWVESYLLKFKKRPTVITIPDLLTPGIRAKIWNKLIIKIFFKFRSPLKLFFTLKVSEKYKSNPKISVVQAIIFISRK